MDDVEYDVIVVGAGVAGGALSTVLARDGRRVLTIERELWRPDCDTPTLIEPDRIVGELLQPGGYAKLVELGLEAAVRHIDAQHIYGYGLFLGERSECIDYVEKDAPAVAGRSFHNGRFLRRLRELAQFEHNVTLVQGTVIALDEDETGRVVGVSYRADDVLHHVRATLTIACDGCASRLRRRAAPQAAPQVYSQFVGMLLDDVQLPYPDHGHVVLAEPAPMLFYPVSSTQVRCLVDVPSTVRTPLREHLLEALAPQLPALLRKPFEVAIEARPLRTMPNRVMPAAPAVIDGAILLGDAFNMRHPLTGGGMTVALSDVAILRRLLRATPDLRNQDALNEALCEFASVRKPLSTTINILANALYSVFCARDEAMVEMRSACVDYLAAGGRCTHDPMALIGGVKPHPVLLVAHFFLVAFYGCGRALAPFPTAGRMKRAWDIFRASFNIIKPLMDAEKLWPICWLPFSRL